MQDLAKKISDNLIINGIAGKIYTKGEIPEEVQELIREIGMEVTENDFTLLDEYYYVLYQVVEMMKDTKDEHFTDDFLMDHEMYDWADISNFDRATWLANNPGLAYIYHEIEGNGAEGIFELIGDMQEFFRYDLATAIYNELRSKA